MEREPVRRPGADAGQPGQLRDEVLDRGAEHAAIVPVWIGPDVLRKVGLVKLAGRASSANTFTRLRRAVTRCVF
jgi:hypothetical protein